MKIVSFYTEKTPYEKVANELLIPSVKKWELDSDIQGVPDRGSWANNTAIKSEYIRDMLLKYKEPVIFLDCDATIEQYPELFNHIPKETDLAYLLFNWYGHWRGQWENRSKMELLSGTMYFGYNEKVLKLVDNWIIKVKENISVLEQKILEGLVNENKDLTLYYLPYEYCCVLMQDYSIPKYITEPVIVHTQASRKYRNFKRNQ